MSILAPFVMHRKRRMINYIAMLVSILCLVGILSQTAFAENTYVITDGKAVTVYTTYTSDPVKVLEEAGVTLSADDLYTAAPGDGVSEITVQRLQKITVYSGDQVLQANSYGESLASLFMRLGITVDDTLSVSKPLDTVTYDGMQVRIDRVHKSTESYTLEIPFDVTYVNDPTLPEGEETVLVEGKAGQMLCRANVVYVNTQETGRTVYEQTVVSKPVNRVVARGTGELVGKKSDTPIIGDGVIVMPTGEVLTYTHTDQFLATAYTKTDAGCDDYTSNGTKVKVGVVAVDPKVVPYGTRMFIVTNDGAYIYGLSTADDCGGAIINKRLDLYFDTHMECVNFGVRDATVYFLGDANWKDN